MQNYDQAKNLVLELVDVKVDMAVEKTINRVVDQISGLKTQIHGEMSDLKSQIRSLEHEAIAVNTNLSVINKTQEQIRTKFIEYAFKTVWVALGSFAVFAIAHLHALI